MVSEFKLGLRPPKRERPTHLGRSLLSKTPAGGDAFDAVALDLRAPTAGCPHSAKPQSTGAAICFGFRSLPRRWPSSGQPHTSRRRTQDRRAAIWPTPPAAPASDEPSAQEGALGMQSAAQLEQPADRGRRRSRGQQDTLSLRPQQRGRAGVHGCSDAPIRFAQKFGQLVCTLAAPQLRAGPKTEESPRGLPVDSPPGLTNFNFPSEGRHAPADHLSAGGRLRGGHRRQDPCGPRIVTNRKRGSDGCLNFFR